MSDPIVFGFPHSTYVHIVRLILTHKGVPYTFRDLETEMGKPTHLALHPFNRVPVLQHGDFTVYETSAIATYIDETFEKPPLQPKNARDRARMHQWISSVNSYYYTYMIYHVTHERRVFPELGIASDEKVVAHALPKIEVGLQVLERQLAHGKEYLLGAHDCGLLSRAVHLLFRPGGRRKGDVSQIYRRLPVAGDHGGVANGSTLSGFLAAARAHRACARVGHLTSPEVLSASNVASINRAAVSSRSGATSSASDYNCGAP